VLYRKPRRRTHRGIAKSEKRGICRLPPGTSVIAAVRNKRIVTGVPFPASSAEVESGSLDSAENSAELVFKGIGIHGEHHCHHIVPFFRRDVGEVNLVEL